MEFQEKGDKDEKHLGELIRKKPKINAYQHKPSSLKDYSSKESILHAKNSRVYSSVNTETVGR